MYENGGEDHASVGMRTPSGEYELPIRGTRLFWTEPGNIAVSLLIFETDHYLTGTMIKFLPLIFLVYHIEFHERIKGRLPFANIYISSTVI